MFIHLFLFFFMVHHNIYLSFDMNVFDLLEKVFEPCHEKTRFMPLRKQRCRSAVQ